MKPIKDIITIEELEGLASRSNFRLGKSIAEQGEFILEKKILIT